MDNILDVGKDTQPLKGNRDCINDWRSIGLGVMGLADMLVALGIKYGDDRCKELCHNLFGRIMSKAIAESRILAKAKMPYGKWKRSKGERLRNGTLISIAPTGTISTMCGISGGIEPLFSISYERTTHSLSDKKQYFKVYAKSVEHLLKYHGIDPNTISEDEIVKRFPFVIASHDIDPMDRVAVQGVIQRNIDNAISSTVNLKNDATVDDVMASIS